MPKMHKMTWEGNDNEEKGIEKKSEIEEEKIEEENRNDNSKATDLTLYVLFF